MPAFQRIKKTSYLASPFYYFNSTIGDDIRNYCEQL